MEEEEEEKTLSYLLPRELMIEILVRLPVKSLICFKCVSKSWFNLISNPQFANSHFLFASTYTPKIMCISDFPPKILSIDLEAFLNHDDHLDSVSRNIDFWLPKSNFSVEMGWCRGFIFLYNFPEFYLWNPSTEFKKQIPLSPFFILKNKRIRNPCNYLGGFGYDQSRDDYLVVVLSFVVDAVSSNLEIFSCRDNMWKQIEGTYFGYIAYGCDRVGLLFNGAIHWLTFCCDLLRTVIVAFDLMERKLLDINLPDADFGHDARNCGLWVFREFLSFWAIDRHTDNKVEIWVMKEYNVYSSWTKTHCLRLHPLIRDYFKPICHTKNGDIIGKSLATILVKHNDKGLESEYRSFCNSQSNVVMYTESLLSLPGANQQV